MAAGSKKVIYAALAGNSGIAITKFIASAFTGSSAMLAEAIHSLVDTGNQGLMLWGLRAAKRPADERFPFGHGKEVYFWSFVVAILIFAVGAGVSLYHGVGALLHPHPTTDPLINYIVLSIAIVFEAFAWYFAWREFNRDRGDLGFYEAVRRGKDPIMFVVLFEDSAAMLGLIVAFIGILLGQITGNPYFDGAATVLIGLILGGTAAWLAYETKGLLIGEAAAPEIRDGIRRLLDADPAVHRVNELATLHMGPETIIAAMSVDFDDTLTAGRIEQSIAALNKAIKAEFPEVHRVFIEAEAWAGEKRGEG